MTHQDVRHLPEVDLHHPSSVRLATGAVPRIFLLKRFFSRVGIQALLQCQSGVDRLHPNPNHHHKTQNTASNARELMGSLECVHWRRHRAQR